MHVYIHTSLYIYICVYIYIHRCQYKHANAKSQVSCSGLFEVCDTIAIQEDGTVMLAIIEVPTVRDWANGSLKTELEGSSPVSVPAIHVPLPYRAPEASQGAREVYRWGWLKTTKIDPPSKIKSKWVLCNSPNWVAGLLWPRDIWTRLCKARR